MFISNLCVRTGRILSLIDWQEVGLIVFHGLIALIVGIWIAGELLGKWVHWLNDILAANWVRLIMPPPSVETEQALIIVEEVDTPMPAVEVELMLPLVLEPMEILFTTPLMLAAAQAPVALLVAGQEVVQQPPPVATSRRRKRGRRAHQNRTRQIV
jgi:hypothetical protein